MLGIVLDLPLVLESMAKDEASLEILAGRSANLPLIDERDTWWCHIRSLFVFDNHGTIEEDLARGECLCVSSVRA